MPYFEGAGRLAREQVVKWCSFPWFAMPGGSCDVSRCEVGAVGGDMDAYTAHLREQLDRTSVFLAVLTGEEPDARQSAELGMAVLLGKVIVVLARKGVVVPAGLERAADEVVRLSSAPDMGLDEEAEIAGALREALPRLRAIAADRARG